MMRIVETLQAIGVLFVSIAVVAWAAFYVLSCHAGEAIKFAAYAALFVAGMLYISAVYLGHRIVSILEEGRDPFEKVIVNLVMFVLMTSSFVVIGQAALDGWTSRLGDCVKAGAYGIGL